MSENRSDPPRRWKPSSATLTAWATLLTAIATLIGTLNGCSPT